MSFELRELELQCYIVEGDADKIKSLAKAGVNLNMQTPDGSMLMLAASVFRWDIVELLIDLGADIDCTDGVFEWKFLHHAARHAWIPVVRLFVERRYDLDVTTSKGETPLMMASRWSHKTVIELLVNAGADVNCCDARQWTAFHHASYNCNLEIVKFLVGRIKDINGPEWRGLTPLHLALKRKSGVEVVGVLLRAGANCNFEDEEGTSAFRLLLERRCVGNIRLGIEKGGYVTATDYYKLLMVPLAENCVLKRMKFCTQAIVNKFNNKDLPDLYKIRVASDVLPDMERLMIKNNGGPEIEINRAVTRYIETKSFCNLTKVRPLVLSMMCVESVLAYVRGIEERVAAKKRKALASLSSLDRLASKKYSSKKLCKYRL